MGRRKKIKSKEIGLELALIVGRHVFKTENLHYGYWTNGLPVDILHLAQAQENHSDLIVSHIPDAPGTILDVGCGSGRLAFKLTNLGYQVDCVSPSVLLSEHARELLGDRSRIFECPYEELETENRYDVILFSESFQYIDMEKALENSARLLNDGGQLLICDFFRTNTDGEYIFTGGHRLDKFEELIARHPFEALEDIDISEGTAPTLEIISSLGANVVLPVWKLFIRYLESNHPLASRFLKWKYRGKIAKIDRKCSAGKRLIEEFAAAWSYRLFLYRKSMPASRT